MRHFIGFCVLFSVALGAAADADSIPQLSNDELLLEAPSQASSPPNSENLSSATIRMFSEASYPNAEGDEVVDLLEKDYAYLSVVIQTEDGTPISGVKPQFTVEGSSRLVPLSELAAGQFTDSEGVFEIAVVGGKMGLDRLTVSFAGKSSELLINVISLEAAGFAAPASIQGALSWDLLTKARIRYGEIGKLTAEFVPEVKAKHNKTVKLAGFMMPLEPQIEQKHFLLASNPPSCFFHIPGGPAGVVEVFADQGINASWELMIVEGRLELLEESIDGAVYRLHNASVVPKDSSQ